MSHSLILTVYSKCYLKLLVFTLLFFNLLEKIEREEDHINDFQSYFDLWYVSIPFHKTLVSLSRLRRDQFTVSY